MKEATFSALLLAGLVLFQSTLPMKEATISHSAILPDTPVSIHASNEGSDFVASRVDNVANVSIHASNEGSDFSYWIQTIIKTVSIHASNEGSDET